MKYTSYVIYEIMRCSILHYNAFHWSSPGLIIIKLHFFSTTMRSKHLSSLIFKLVYLRNIFTITFEIYHLPKANQPSPILPTSTVRYGGPSTFLVQDSFPVVQPRDFQLWFYQQLTFLIVIIYYIINEICKTFKFLLKMRSLLCKL